MLLINKDRKKETNIHHFVSFQTVHYLSNQPICPYNGLSDSKKLGKFLLVSARVCRYTYSTNYHRIIKADI